ncbi:pentapeptide repeat-containing protein [Orenia marismortui]|uniref:pentapeptide repeat-containing protein n=1 Tax=Orenia marismortui TaxID=46469 RepID=UPI00036D22AE|nr:pentapeptide repeat-containing protein [Orenia marismortui]
MSYNICEYKNCERGKWKEDKEHCIFHSKKCKEKKEEFKNQILKEFKEQQNDLNKETISLEGFIFPEFDFLSNEKISKPISFSNAEFYKKVDLKGTTFCNEVDFSYVKFFDGINCRETNFLKEVSFPWAKFSGTAFFFRHKIF